MHWYGSYYSYHYSNLYIYRSWCERLLKSGTKIILWYSNEWLLKDYTLFFCAGPNKLPIYLWKSLETLMVFYPLLLNVKREREQAVGLSAEEGMGGHCNTWLHVTIITDHIRDPHTHTQLHSPFMHREIELIKLIRIRQKELCQDAYTHIHRKRICRALIFKFAWSTLHHSW